MSDDIHLMKGNEALAHAAIRYGTDAFFGYPITPQTEVMETLMAEHPWTTTGMTVMQVESEISAISMVHGAAATGRRAFTSSSGPGISLMQEGISYLCGQNLPCLIVNVMRGGPGLGTIQPSQADYNQAVKGGGHGDYRLYTLAPWSVQEMADFVGRAFDWAFAHRNPAMILSDATIGQMMEKVVLPPARPRRTDAERDAECPWAANGTMHRRGPNRIISLDLDAAALERKGMEREAMYRRAEEEDVLYECDRTDDADIVIVAFGSAARVCTKAVDMARAQGLKLGLLRPITLWPFPTRAVAQIAQKARGILTVELNAGQMVADVRIAAAGRCPVEHYGRMGGSIFGPQDVIDAAQRIFKTEE